MRSFIAGMVFFLTNALILKAAVGRVSGLAPGSLNEPGVKVGDLVSRKKETTTALNLALFLFVKFSFLLGSTFVNLRILGLKPLEYVSGSVFSCLVLALIALSERPKAI